MKPIVLHVHWIIKVFSISISVLFCVPLVISLVQKKFELLPLFLFFVLLGIALFAISLSYIRIDDEAVTIAAIPGPYRIAWNEVARIKINNYLVAFEGNEKRLVLSLSDYITKRKMIFETLDRLAADRQIPVSLESFPRTNKNVRIRFSDIKKPIPVIERAIPAMSAPVPSPVGGVQAVPGVLQATRTQDNYRNEKMIENTANYFFWIAGLSLINTLGLYFKLNLTFIVGLGITQFIDGFSHALAEDRGGNTGVLTLAISFGLDLLLISFFVLCGIFGRRKKRWAFIAGMVLYTLDALFYLFLLLFGVSITSVLWNIGFHAIFLIGIFRGFTILRKSNEENTPYGQSIQ